MLIHRTPFDLKQPFDVKHLHTRRDWFTRMGLTAAGLYVCESDWMAAKAQALNIVATPALTEGPYWVEEGLNRADLRVDTSNSAVSPGFPLALGICVSRLSNGSITPVNSARVDIWHCDAGGLYSDVAANSTVGRKFLRGYQNTDAHGNARFITIYPGWYSGRTVHMHYRVRLLNNGSTTLNFASQLFFDETVTNSVYALTPYSSRPNRTTLNAGDNILQSGGTTTLLRLAKDGNIGIASFNVMLNI